MRFLTEALAWLADPAHLTGSDGVLVLAWEHLWTSLAAVAIAAVVAVPAGWYVGHSKRFRGAAVVVSGAARALPTLGVVTLFGLLLGIGLAAPLLAFVVLAVPSVLAGAYAGVEAADQRVVDAARASGMTGAQVLWQVEVPLGLPVLVGGLRSATLQVISTATLAAYVGAGGLGRLVFLGLKTQDYPMMLAASLVVVLLAVASEAVFVGLQRLASAGGRRRPA